MAKLQQTWRLICGHWRTLAGLILLVYVPLYAVEAGVIYWAGVPQDDADKGLGLVNVFFMPLVNGGIVWLVDRWRRGDAATLAQALAGVRTYWSRLLTTYVSVSFILLGWLVITVLPPYIAMMILKVEQVFVLVPFAAFGVVMGLSNYAFIDPLIVVAGLGPYHARFRSVQLVKGRRLPVIGYGLLLYSLPLLLELGGELLPTLSEQTPRGLGLSMLLGLVSALLYVVPVVFFYVYYCEVDPSTSAEAVSHDEARAVTSAH